MPSIVLSTEVVRACSDELDIPAGERKLTRVKLSAKMFTVEGELDSGNRIDAGVAK